jgi:hypothetical protein
MGNSACSAHRCETRNQNKQPTPQVVLLPKEGSALSHKQPVSGQLHMPVRKLHIPDAMSGGQEVESLQDLHGRNFGQVF